MSCNLANVRKVIFKTIVTHPRELPFVLMNLYELEGIYDEFLITEANVSHVGIPRNFAFESTFDKHIKPFFPKAKYLKMDIRNVVQSWNKSSEISHNNEQIIRSSWTNYISRMKSRDIVISTDADEVLYRKFTKFLVFVLKLWPRNKLTSFTLTLNQFLYFVNLYWVDSGFYGPVVAHAGYYMQQENPEWRYGGRRFIYPHGCHFAWVMTPEEMKEKLLSYAHRAENEALAKTSILQKAIEDRSYIFGNEQNIEFREIQHHKNSLFPKSLAKAKPFVRRELIIKPQEFWEDVKQNIY